MSSSSKNPLDPKDTKPKDMPTAEEKSLKAEARKDKVSTGKNPALVSPTLVLDLQTRIKQLEQRDEELHAHIYALCALAEEKKLWDSKEFEKAFGIALSHMPSVQERRKKAIARMDEIAKKFFPDKDKDKDQPS